MRIFSGFNGIWFGVVLVVLIELGQITPPVGLNLIAIQPISTGTPLSKIAKGAFPYTLILIFVIIILYVFPQIVLYLPNLMSH